MPRRLGDDPLARAKAAQASALVSPDTAGGGASAEVRTSRSSYNDVFFQRRGEGEAPQPSTNEGAAPEAPEISEISEIPEIREAAAVTSAAEMPVPVAPTIEASPAVEGSGSAELIPPAPASTIAEVVASLSAPIAAPAPEAPEAANSAEPQKGGFFKRLFGKLK